MVSLDFNVLVKQQSVPSVHDDESWNSRGSARAQMMKRSFLLLLPNPTAFVPLHPRLILPFTERDKYTF